MFPFLPRPLQTNTFKTERTRRTRHRHVGFLDFRQSSVLVRALKRQMNNLLSEKVALALRLQVPTLAREFLELGDRDKRIVPDTNQLRYALSLILTLAWAHRKTSEEESITFMHTQFGADG
jgi:hypothetical protein